MSEKCGATCEVYSRCTGYFRPVSAWNKGKVSEWSDRKMFKISSDMKTPGIFSKKESEK